MVVLTSLWPQQRLHGPDVVAGLEQMGGERMPQRVRRGRALDSRTQHRALESALEGLVEEVVPAPHSRARVHRQVGLREDPEPRPLSRCLRVLSFQRVRQLHPAAARRRIGRPQRTRPLQLIVQRRHQRGRQHHRPILAALAAANDDGAELEVHILHPQLQRLENSHPRAVKQLRQRPMLALQQRQHPPHFCDRHHRRQTRLALGPNDLVHPRQVSPQHLLVQKQQCRQSLAVRRHRHIALGRQPRQERLDFRMPHLARMAHALVPNEGLHPMDIGLLGA